VDNKDSFLSLDFGLKEFGVVDPEERLKRYRRYVYEAGALDRSDAGSARVIDKDIVEKEDQTPDNPLRSSS
jgi:putative transposase